jgi:hypothetical protein
MTSQKRTPSNEADGVVEVYVPIAFRQRGHSKRIVAPNGIDVFAAPEQPNSTLVKALARAFRWRKLLEDGTFTTLSELASAEKINPSYVSRVLRLTLLDPRLVDSILNGTQLDTVTLRRLMKPFPAEWESQQVL